MLLVSYIPLLLFPEIMFDASAAKIVLFFKDVLMIFYVQLYLYHPLVYSS